MQDLLLPAADIFYDCVEDNFDYQRAVNALSHAACDTGFVLSENWPVCGNKPPLASCNIPQDCLDVLIDGGLDLNSHDAFQKFMLIPEQSPTLLRNHMSIEEHYESRLHVEASKPWGMHCEGVSILNKSGDNGLACWFVRYPGQSEIEQELTFQIRFLSQQLNRALMLQEKIDRLHCALSTANNMLDLLSFGLVLFGQKETPVYANSAAKRISQAGDGIALDKNGLVLSEHNAKRKLDHISAAIKKGNLNTNTGSGETILVARPSGKRAYNLIVVPLAKYNNFGMENINMAVMIFDPHSKKKASSEIFSSSYGLTAAESMLATELAHGVSLDEFAIRKGISANTARTQLKSIFSKTETSRQHELVSLLLRSIAGINLD